VCRARVQQYNGNVSVCLKDRCEQVYERRQQTSKGPDKRRNRESTWLTAVAALDTPEAFPAATYGLGLRVPAKSQLLSARYIQIQCTFAQVFVVSPFHIFSFSLSFLSLSFFFFFFFFFLSILPRVRWIRVAIFFLCAAKGIFLRRRASFKDGTRTYTWRRQ